MKILIKTYTRRHYAQKFIERGEMLFRPLKDFRVYNDEGIRGDMEEGVVSFPVYDNFYNTSVNVKYYAGANIYCMTVIDSYETIDKSIFPKIQEFGKYCVIIKDYEHFLSCIRSVKTKYLKNGILHSLTFGAVEYVDGDRPNIFIKPKMYEYQHEFRISCSPPIFGVRNFIYIGKLTDTALIKSCDLQEYIHNLFGIR